MKTSKKKTNRLLPFALVVFLMLMGMGCEEEIATNCEGDNAQPVETFFTEDFEIATCQLNAENIDHSEKETHLIIKTQSDFEKYVSCTENAPTIDFDEYFVLAGIYRHQQCAIFDRQSVVLCEERLIYRVRLLEQDCLAITSVTYFTVISKDHDSKEVEFDVQFSN